MLDEDGIAVRAGHHCCQPLMRRFGISGTTRASFYIYNTEQEVDKLAHSLERAKTLFDACAPGTFKVQESPKPASEPSKKTQKK